MVEPRITPWKVLRSRYSYKDRWLGIRSDTVELSDGSVLDPYHTVEYPDCVIAIALTQEDEVLLVEQYRHGAGATLLEFPAGAVEAGEDRLEAVRRELLEETGYSSAAWQFLGSTYAGAGRLSNQYHGYLALDARLVATPRRDSGELVRVVRPKWDEFVKRVKGGELMLMEAGDVAAFFQLHLFAGRSTDARIKRLRL